MSKLKAVRELWDFMKTRKRFWLTPIVLILLAVGVLLIVSQASTVAPFIYTFF